MADHPDPSPRHSAHERTEHVPPSALPLLASSGRDTAVILLATATAIFLALAVALSLMLWRARSDGNTLAAGTASASPSTPDASAAAQPVAPAPSAPAVPGETAASAAQEAEESAHAEESATAEAEASETAQAEATAHATESAAADPDAATTDHGYLPVTGKNPAVPWLIGSGLGLTLAGFVLAGGARRRVSIVFPTGDAGVSAVEALRQALEKREPPKDADPQPRRLDPADQTIRLRRVAERAGPR